MLIFQIVLGISFACQNTGPGKEYNRYAEPDSSSDTSVSKLIQKSHPFMKQVSEELKLLLTTNIMKCLLTRRNPMEKNDQVELGKTVWFDDWNRHCGELIDPACPGVMGECWAMAVLMCRKNCDAKFLLRGNRKKFKRCIYKELKVYEKDHPNTVDESCSVQNNNPLTGRR